METDLVEAVVEIEEVVEGLAEAEGVIEVVVRIAIIMLWAKVTCIL